MRGRRDGPGRMFFTIHLEGRIAANHPLRQIKLRVDCILASTSEVFDGAYSKPGRPRRDRLPAQSTRPQESRRVLRLVQDHRETRQTETCRPVENPTTTGTGRNCVEPVPIEKAGPADLTQGVDPDRTSIRAPVPATNPPSDDEPTAMSRLRRPNRSIFTEIEVLQRPVRAFCSTVCGRMEADLR